MTPKASRTLIPALVLGAMFCSALWAQAPTTQVDLPAQSLVDAVKQLARQTNTNVSFDRNIRALMESREARALKANVTVDEAFAELLAGSGLRHRFVNEHTVVLMAADGQLGVSSEASSISTGFEPLQLAQQDEGFIASQAAQQGTSNIRETQTVNDVDESRGSPASDIQEIVVTAQKRAERLQDVPISISVLSGDELDKSSFTSLREVLATVPGVATLQTSENFSGTFITIRGVGAANHILNGSSPIAYYLDAIPFALLRFAFAPDLNPFDLERIEVLRGPQGTLYGANSTNGLVRVLTKDANLDKFELKTRAALSSTKDSENMGYRGDLALNVPIVEGKLAARAVVGYEDLAGWIDGPLGEDLNDGEVQNYRLKVNAQPTDALSIGLSAWFSRGSYGASNISNDERRRLATNILPEPKTDDFDAYSLEVGYAFRRFSLASTTGYFDYSNTGKQDITHLSPIFINPFIAAVDYAALTQEVILTSNEEERWKWTFGGYYRDAEERGAYSLLPFTGTVVGQTDRSKSFAFFGEVGRRFWGEKLGWALGLRYFKDETESEEVAESVPPGSMPFRNRGAYDAVLPRVVLTWYPSRGATVYGSYSQGFRSGLTQSLFTEELVPGLPSMEPDKLTNYEIGAKMDVLDGRLSLDSAIYYIDWQDVQQVVGIAFEGTFSGVFSGEVAGLGNGASASGVGVDFGLTARPTEGVALGLTVGWNDLTFDEEFSVLGALYAQEGDRLNLSSEYTLGAWVEHAFPLGASGFTGRLGASATYTSPMSQRAAGTASAPFELSPDSILISRARVSIGSPNDHWTIALFADNLNDENGKVTRYSGRADLASRVRPRTVGLQVDFNF